MFVRPDAVAHPGNDTEVAGWKRKDLSVVLKRQITTQYQ